MFCEEVPLAQTNSRGLGCRPRRVRDALPLPIFFFGGTSRSQ